MINSNKIKGRMREFNMTQSEMSKILNIAQSSLNLKINNIRPMTLDEADCIATALNIPDVDFSTYFFAR